jgi:LPXTG-motif cell wall-anchored protein
MSTSMRPLARAFSAVVTAIFVVLALGAVVPSYAAPGNGNGVKAGQATGVDSAATATRHGKSAASADKATKSPGTSKAGGHATSGTAGTSGDPTQPQPLSNADQNTGGANGQCPGGVYCSTRDGSPSMNGNGDGQSTGKPCAGCVGKADNKNPKGQLPGPQDRNNGYECDGNNGIAKGNPAHTGCTSAPPEECVPVEGQDADCNPVVPPEECVPVEGQDADCNPVVPPEECVPVEGQDENCNAVVPPNRPPAVLGNEVFAPHPAAQVKPAQAMAAAVLPNTGSSSGLGLLVFAGFGMVLAGAATMVLRRSAVRSAVG